MHKLYISLTIAVAGIAAASASARASSVPALFTTVHGGRTANVEVRVSDSAKMTMKVSQGCCTHQYQGPVLVPESEAPLPLHPDESFSVTVRVADSLSAHDLCINRITMDAPSCTHCSPRADWDNGIVHCTNSPADDPVFPGVMLTYKFKPTDLAGDYHKKVEEASWSGVAYRDYLAAKDALEGAQRTLARFVPYQPEPRPHGRIGRIVWSAKAVLHRSAERQLAEKSNRDYELLRNRVAECALEWEKKQALREELVKDLDAERTRLNTHVAPRICEAVRLHVWPQLLARLPALRLAAKERGAADLAARKIIAELKQQADAERDREYERRWGIVAKMRETGILGRRPSALHSHGTRVITSNGVVIELVSLDCEILCPSLPSVIEIGPYLEGSCLLVAPPPPRTVTTTSIYAELQTADDSRHPYFHFIDCFGRSSGDRLSSYFGSYRVRVGSSSDVFRGVGSSLYQGKEAASGLCHSLLELLRTVNPSGMPLGMMTIPIQFRTIE